MKNALFAFLLVAAPALAACDSGTDTPDAVTITAAVVADAQLSTLEAAVVRANLATTLAGPGPFTVFAPTDAAFTAALTALGLTAEQLLANPALADILTLHVVAGSLTAAQLSDGQTLTTVNGETLTVRIAGGRVGIDTEDADTAPNAFVSTADISASNGVIHKIDAVLLPAPTATITETVVADAQLSTLEAAVVRAGLAGTLSGTGPFTVFAPTDAAFQAALTALGLTAEQLLALPNLGEILTFHVVPGAVVASQLSDGQVLTTVNGQTLTVRISGGVVGFDSQDAGAEPDATVVTADIGASNGVIHKIGAVLLPVAP
jgi:uncharacterized surface protein with fasciclin (FAS1) repeats